MGYNIDTFKVKKLEGLVIPIKSLYKHSREDWHPEREVNEDGTVSFLNISTSLTGNVVGDNINVTKINFSGEGSGTAMEWILVPALAESTGELVASCVWEGGDTINKLIVKDGKVRWEDIEI